MALEVWLSQSGKDSSNSQVWCLCSNHMLKAATNLDLKDLQPLCSSCLFGKDT